MLAIAALVKMRPHRLKVESKLLPNDGRERKWVNTNPDDRGELLSTMSECESRTGAPAVDYIVGTARARFEDEDASIHVIKKRISIARRY